MYRCQNHVQLDDYTLKSVKSFCYLGSTVTTTASMDNEVSLRISKSCTSFGNLRHRLWSERGIKLSTKIAIYRAVVIPTLLYSAEAWTPYRKHISQLDAFHMRCLCSILGNTWEDKVTNRDVLTRCNIMAIRCTLIKQQTRWAGHVIRMYEDGIPNSLLYSQL